MKKILISLFLFVSIITEAKEINYIPFKYLETKEGIGAIRSIYRDKNDFIWIGSEDNGLIKYNSESVIFFKNIPSDSTSISGNYVSKIIGDSNNNIWIITNTGINKMNLSSSYFKRYEIKGDPKNKIIVYDLFEDSNKRLWFCTNNGLYKFNKDKDIIKHHSLNLGDNNVITSIKEDKKGNLWLALISPAIIKYTPTTNHLKSYRINNLSNNNLKEILIDSEDNIWLGICGYSFASFNTNSEIFTHYRLNKNGKGINTYLTNNLIEFDDENILIGTNQGGINVFNKNNKKFNYINSFQGNAGSLTSDGILTLSIDNEGILWAGTSRGGVNYYNPKESRFKVYKKGDNNPFSEQDKFLSNGVVGCLMEDCNGLIWVGTDGGGINILNRKTDFFKTLSTANSRIRANTIRSLTEDSKGNVIICSWPNLLDKYNPTTGEITPFKLKGEYMLNHSDGIIWDASFDSLDRLWIATNLGDVVMYDKNGNQKFYAQFTPGNKLGVNKVFTSICKKKIVLVGPSSGLLFWDESAFNFKESNIKIRDIICLDFNENQDLAIGTENSGVYIYNKDLDFVGQFNKNQGLSSNTTSSLKFTAQNEIWVSTNKGLNQILINDSTIFTYNKSDGLQGNQYFSQSSLKTKDGELYFGGTNGLDSFYPNKIKRNTYIPKIYINNINVYSKKEDVGEKSIKPSGIDTIHLDWHQNHLEITFQAHVYTLKHKTQYKYALLGTDGGKYQKGFNNKVVFNYLKPGKYRFHIMASNSDGIWNTLGDEKIIIIEKPFWNKTWFYLIVSALIIALTLFIIHWRERALRIAKISLQKEVKSRTKTIVRQNRLLVKQKEELQNHKYHLESMVESRTKQLILAKEKAEKSDRLKSYFLANLSHEIRTPMNAIVGFSSLLKDVELNKEELEQFINQIIKNSNALLMLIEDILDFSQIEANQLKIKKNSFYVSNLIDEVYSSFIIQNDNKKLEIKKSNHLTNTKILLNSDEYRIRQILVNLMGNALKFTKEGIIEIGVQINTNNIEFYIKDSGIGINKEQQEVIFNQFVKLSRDQISGKPGIGLGLAICKQLSLLLGGNLSVKSTPGKGSIFTFSIPLKNENKVELQQLEYIKLS